MTDVDFSDISMEHKGSMLPGRLKITETQIHFKPKASGKVTSIADTDIDLVNWMRHGSQYAIRIFTNVGTLMRFAGFKEADKEKLSKAISNRFNKNLVDMEVCLKGWNWGTAKFKGSVLSFEAGNAHAFDVPLTYVSQCTTGKNEVTLEFHQNDDARDSSLMELRFHMPSSDNAGDTEPVDVFKEQVLSKADVIGAVGDAIAIFRENNCLTPRGRYDIKLYQSFFQLHGKTFDYKIPLSTVLRLFLLPHIDGRQMYFVVHLDPPIKQGQTRYHFLVFLFPSDEECSIELPFTDKELETKYGGKLEKELSGPTFHVVSKIMKIMIDRKLTGPGKFTSSSKQNAVGCSYKAAAGYLYPLDRGFMFVHKPPLHIRMEDITGVNFVRSGGGTKSFDIEIELKSGVIHSFVSILKEEYGKLHEFTKGKGIRVKSNPEKIDYDGRGYDERKKGEPDAYLARVKAEAEERSDDDGGSESSEDEDYNPEATKASDVSEESDSGSASGSGGGSGSASDASDSGKKKKKQKKGKSPEKSTGSKRGEASSSKKPKGKESSRKSSRAGNEKSEKKSQPGTAGASSKPKKSRKTESPGKGASFKSKEFISESESSGDGAAAEHSKGGDSD